MTVRPVRDGDADLGFSVDLCRPNHGERASRHPLVEDVLGQRAVRFRATVELFDEGGEDATVLTRVGQPVPGIGPGDPAQADVVAEAAEDDLDPPRLTGTPARGRTIDGAVLGRRGGTDCS
ncbi:MAG: hypothetical protein ACRDY3_08310 [Acidimicrobiales bacterium]